MTFRQFYESTRDAIARYGLDEICRWSASVRVTDEATFWWRIEVNHKSSSRFVFAETSTPIEALAALESGAREKFPEAFLEENLSLTDVEQIAPKQEVQQ